MAGGNSSGVEATPVPNPQPGPDLSSRGRAAGTHSDVNEPVDVTDRLA